MKNEKDEEWVGWGMDGIMKWVEWGMIGTKNGKDEECVGLRVRKIRNGWEDEYVGWTICRDIRFNKYRVGWGTVQMGNEWERNVLDNEWLGWGMSRIWVRIKKVRNGKNGELELRSSED